MKKHKHYFIAAVTFDVALTALQFVPDDSFFVVITVLLIGYAVAFSEWLKPKLQ